MLTVYILLNWSITLFKFLEGLVGLRGPPDLRSHEGGLSGPVEHPLVTRLVLVRFDTVLEYIAECVSHAIRDSIQPYLHLDFKTQNLFNSV